MTVSVLQYRVMSQTWKINIADMFKLLRRFDFNAVAAPNE